MDLLRIWGEEAACVLACFFSSSPSRGARQVISSQRHHLLRDGPKCIVDELVIFFFGARSDHEWSNQPPHRFKKLTVPLRKAVRAALHCTHISSMQEEGWLPVAVVPELGLPSR